MPFNGSESVQDGQPCKTRPERLGFWYWEKYALRLSVKLKFTHRKCILDIVYWLAYSGPLILLRYMALMSPFRYRLHLIKEAIFGDNEIVFEVLVHHKANLPNNDIRVEWKRDGEYIVGEVHAGGELYVAQGRTAKEFIETVNDALYATYSVPLKYAEKLGGAFRIAPSIEEFKRLNDAAIKGSNINFGHEVVPA